ncbi:MAG: type II toxin-antitoxin system VapC family toxin [Planctomycetaceae bacterium]|nr:type II toxin-antitoxin system VapC family toxin [Planctomycetaceae bacterium]
MIILDTDHMTVLQQPESQSAQVLTTRLAASPDREIMSTAVTLEEQLRGWLALLNRYRDVRQQSKYYDNLTEMLRFYNGWRLLGFDQAAGNQFLELKHLRASIGPNDLKIASVTLTRNALLLTSNAKHFSRVPGLRFEDWTIPQNPE